MVCFDGKGGEYLSHQPCAEQVGVVGVQSESDRDDDFKCVHLSLIHILFMKEIMDTSLVEGYIFFFEVLDMVGKECQHVLLAVIGLLAQRLVGPVSYTHLFRTWLVGKALSQEKRQTYVMFIQNGKAGYC